MFGIAFELLNLARSFVNVGKETAGRLAIETSRRQELVVTLLPFGPCFGIEFGPIIPALFRRKRCEMTAARSGIEGFAVIVLVLQRELILPWSAGFFLQSVYPVIRLATKMHHCHYFNLIFMKTVNNAVRKSLHSTAPG